LHDVPYSELRTDPLTGDRVIVAPGRADRPLPLGGSAERPRPPRSDPTCPFCPGNEAETTTELYRLPPGEGTGWRLRVFANKYPALSASVPREFAAPSGPWESEPAPGRHEVIVETRRHDLSMTELSDSELFEVLRTYRGRFAAAAADPHLVGQEVEDGSRLIETSDRYATYVPYAAAHDHEVWVAPRFLPPRFDHSDDGTLQGFGVALRRALAVVAEALGDPDYNFILHSPPLLERAEDVLPWYGQIIPRQTVAAGFELAVGVRIVETRPEEAAARLRTALSKVAGV
jgi:UDPglucose--hexose-1-phosphate uridylyltransferase